MNRALGLCNSCAVLAARGSVQHMGECGDASRDDESINGRHGNTASIESVAIINDDCYECDGDMLHSGTAS